MHTWRKNCKQISCAKKVTHRLEHADLANLGTRCPMSRQSVDTPWKERRQCHKDEFVMNRTVQGVRRMGPDAKTLNFMFLETSEFWFGPASPKCQLLELDLRCAETHEKQAPGGGVGQEGRAFSRSGRVTHSWDRQRFSSTS